MIAELESIELEVMSRTNLEESLGEMSIDDSDVFERGSSDGTESVKRKSELETPSPKKMAKRGVKRAHSHSPQHVKEKKKEKVSVPKLGTLSDVLLSTWIFCLSLFLLVSHAMQD